jgi:hypothetical protein
MKNVFGLLVGVITFFLFSCNKINTSMPLPKLDLPDTAETKPAFNSTALGVYKAVLTGNAGKLKIYINNGDSIVKAFLSVDSLSDTLSCLQNFVAGHAINNATFTGRISSFNLSAAANGDNALLKNIIVTDHGNVIGVISHEKSDTAVYCYESIFTGTEKGIFNFLWRGNLIKGVAISKSNGLYSGTGFFTGNIFLIQMTGTGDATFEGGLDDHSNYCSGSWNSGAGIASGVFSGKRTL